MAVNIDMHAAVNLHVAVDGRTVACRGVMARGVMSRAVLAVVRLIGPGVGMGGANTDEREADSEPRSSASGWGDTDHTEATLARPAGFSALLV
jgi:hypothetical protein